MKVVKTKDAVGHVLCHDITQIIKDVKKDVAFKKGHIVEEADIPVLLSLGKDHLYIWEKKEGVLHEDEAAEMLCALCEDAHMKRSSIREGKIELRAMCDGVFAVDKETLQRVNMVEEIMIATRHHLFPVKKGDLLLGTRIIPVLIEEKKMHEVCKLVTAPITKIFPFKAKRVGVVTTGNEVYHGRIKDTFTPVIKEKVAQYQIEITAHQIVPDETNQIAQAIKQVKQQGVDFIICTGGMSVDPDDLTPAAIQRAGARIETYGAPVLPGAMFLLGYFEDKTPIMGIPGCAMYTKTTIFDLVLPSIVAGYPLMKKDIIGFGEGGLCLQCENCIFPNCGFGK